MFSQLSSKERIGYLAISGLILFGFGFVGFRQLKRPAEITFQPLAASPPATQTPSNADVVVHVVGAVKNPGIVHLGIADRVDDAIRRCGGARAEADLEAINLAAKVVDGSQLLVPTKGKAEEAQVAEPYRGGENDSYLSRPAASPSRPSGSKPAPHSISINTANAGQLDLLPGVGPATAQKILDYRQQHGGFSSIDELMAVKGIGPKKMEAIRPFVRL